MVIKIREDVARIKKRAALLSLVVGVVLLSVKFVAYWLTNSSAIFSDALESVVNVAAAGFMLFSIQMSRKPADAGHPYGHGKVEFLSAGFEGAVIITAALLIIYKVTTGLVESVALGRIDTGLILVGAAAVVNAAVGFYLVRVGKKVSSPSLEADGKHLLTDVATSIGVLLGLVLVKVTGLVILDSIVAVLVALYILWIGAKLLNRSFGGMLDQADAHDDMVIKHVLEGPCLRGEVCGYHRVRSRKSGGFSYVDFHLLIPRDLDLGKAHAIATDIEGRIANALGEAGVMAHLEPCRNDHCSNCHIKDCLMRGK